MADFNFDIFKTNGTEGTKSNSTSFIGDYSNAKDDLTKINPFTDTTDADITDVSILAQENKQTEKLRSAKEINEKFDTSDIANKSENTKSKEVSTDTKLAKLQQEREVKQNKLTEAQNKYNEVANGTHQAEIKEAKATCDEKQEAYLKAVDESSNPIIQELKGRIESTEKEISSTETFIQDYTVNIEQTVTDISANESRIKAKNTIIKSCRGKLSSLQGKLGNIKDEDKKNILQNQIAGIYAQLGQEEAQKQTLETIKKSLEDKKAEFENEKKLAQEKLAALMQEKKELDDKVKITFDLNVRKALEEYNTARSNYYELMAKAEEEKANALKEVEQARGEVAEVDAKIVQREAEIIQEKIAEQARQMAEKAKAGKIGQMSPVSGNSTNVDNQAASESQLETLQNNVKEAKEELSSKERLLFSIYDGTSKDISELRNAKDKNFNAFIDTLISAGNTDIVKDIKESKTKVDGLERTYLSKCKAVAELESQMGVATSGGIILSQQITSLQDAKSTLNGTDKSGLNSDQQTKLATTINELNTELENLTTQKQKTDGIVNDAQKLQKLREERDNAKKEYDAANTDLLTKMQNAAKSNTDNKAVSESMDKYTKSATEYDAKIISETEGLNNEIAILRAKVNSLSQTLGVAEGKKLTSKYRFGGSGGAIVDIARSYIGKNEADGSADMFWKGQGVNWSSKKMPWCAAFVSYVLKESGVQFDKNDYTYSVTGLRQWGEKNGKYIEGGRANSDNVKPGDVVIWKGGYFSSHTGIVSAVYDDGSYDTIEGNYANKVSENKGNGRTGKYKMSRTTGFISV